MTKQKPKPKPVKPLRDTVIKRDYTWYWLTAGFLLTLVVYLPSLTNGFTNWDDPEYVNNPYVKNLSPAGIAEIFSVFYMGNYHPLTLLSLGIDRLTGGDNPFIFHFTNLLLHLLNTFLVFQLVKQITRNNLLALLTFMLFGVHTLHVESVAWISERKDVLYSSFFLVSLIIYTTWASTRKRMYYMLSLLFFLLSLLAKGQAVVLVAILPFIDHVKDRKWFSIAVLSEKIPFFLLSLIFGYAAFRAQGSGNAFRFEYFAPHERIAFAFFGFSQYLVKSIFPVGLSAIYPYPVKLINGSIPSFYWLFIIPLPLYLWGIYLLFKRSRIYAFGLGMFFLSLLPLLQLIPVGTTIMADRYFYMPSVGLLLCFAFGLLEIKKSRIRYALFTLFLFVLSGLSFSRCRVWKDSLTLWDDVIRKYDYAQLAYYNRGAAYWKLGKPDKAITDYSSVIGINPVFAEAYYGRAANYGVLGQWDKVIADYTRATEINPKYATAFYNRGLAYSKLEQWDKAMADYSRAVEIDPEYATAYISRGSLYGTIGQHEKAIADFSIAVRIDPGNATAWSNRGLACASLGQWDKAIADYSRAVEIDPGFATAWSNRGNLYGKLGQHEKAIADYSQAIRIDPNSVTAYTNRGSSYGKLGQHDKAIADFSEAIRIDPKYAPAWFDRGFAYSELGQWKEAIADYSMAIALDPAYTRAYSNREIAYKKLGNEKKK
jgi:protein O-mannosyl-transferase